AHHQDAVAACAAGAAAPPSGNDGRKVRLVAARPRRIPGGIVTDRLLELPRTDFLARHGHEELPDVGKAEPAGEFLEGQRRPAFALEHLLDALAPVRRVALQFAGIEPLANFRTRARAAQIAELRVQPVERG